MLPQWIRPYTSISVSISLIIFWNHCYEVSTLKRPILTYNGSGFSVVSIRCYVTHAVRICLEYHAVARWIWSPSIRRHALIISVIARCRDISPHCIWYLPIIGYGREPRFGVYGIIYLFLEMFDTPKMYTPYSFKMWKHRISYWSTSNMYLYDWFS